MVVIYILIAILIFSMIIMIHEFGHFIVAKLCGIRVNEFSLGMGPKIISWGKGETKYSWRALPIGGFVSMEGEDDDSNDPRAFRRKKVWQRLLVVLAGAFMNLVLGFVLIIIVTSCTGDIATTTVAKFDELYNQNNAPSHLSGLEIGDEIIKINNQQIHSYDDILSQCRADEDFTVEMTVIRNGEELTLPTVKFDSIAGEDGSKDIFIDFKVDSGTTVVSEFDKKYSVNNAPSHLSGLEENDRIVRVNGMRIYTDTDIAYQFGVDEDAVFEMIVERNGQMVTLPAVKFDYTVSEDGARSLHIDFSIYGEKPTFTSVLSYSSRKFVSVAKMIWLSLADLVKGRYSINDLSGPVGIVGAIGEVVGTVNQGVNIAELLADLASFVVFITINVGIFNLLPVPALDGARAVFLIIEGIRRKPIKPEHEGMVHLIGMAALLILMAVVTVSDVIKLF